MRRLILFCGLPGSGKTTISRRLCDAIGAQLIDLDDFKKTDVDPLLVKSEIDPPEVRLAYYQKGLCEAVRLFATGIQNIIVDEVFHLATLRHKIELFCHAHRISIVWIEVRCPYEVVKERLLTHPRVGHILSSEEALRMHRLFDSIFEPFTGSNGARHIVIENAHTDGFELLTHRILQELD